MNKHEFKQELEELLWTYLHDNRSKKDLPNSISFDYIIKEPNKNSYGGLMFYSDKKDILLKIKSIDYKD